MPCYSHEIVVFGPGSVVRLGLAGFDGHAMRLNSQAAMEDLSVSERNGTVD